MKKTRLLIIAAITLIMALAFAACNNDKTYTVTFHNNGGTSISPVTQKEGSQVAKPDDPTKFDAVFGGWYYDSELSNSVTFPFTLDKNYTLYAKWDPDISGANTYTITYRDVGDTAFSGIQGDGYPTSHTYGTTTYLISPSKINYTFGGWFTNSNGTGTALTSLAAKGYTANITVYAKWILNNADPATYTLKCYTIKSDIIEDIYVDPDDMTDEEKLLYDSSMDMYGKTAVISNDSISFSGLLLGAYNPAKYTLSGVNVIFENFALRETFSYATLENNVFNLGYVSDDIGFVLEYRSPKYIAPKYKLIFNYNDATGGTYLSELNLEFNKAIGTLPAPTKTGYTFNGWWNADTGFISSKTKFTWKKDVTVSADWKVNSYKVSFTHNGGTGSVPSTVTATYDSAMPTISVKPIRAGYGFTGYYDSWISEDGTKYYNADLSSAKTLDKDYDFKLYAGWEKLDIGMGLGTYLDPYRITTKEQLINFAQTVNDGEKHSDKYFELTTNINLGGAEWVPIGGTGAYFGGNFNGNGYVVSNYKITSSHAHTGLFGNNYGIIRNLGVENFSININLSADSHVYAGGLVGQLYTGKILNCYATGEISVAHSNSSWQHSIRTGGLVGYTYSGTIINSYAIGNVSAVSTNGSVEAGGLIGGNNYGQMMNCFATGNISATSTLRFASAGGLVGQGSGDPVINCYRYTEQIFYRKAGSTTYSSANNNMGTECSLENLQSEIWVKQNLWSFESQIWTFAVNRYPVLNPLAFTSDVKISTTAQLLELQDKTLTLSYKLVANINLVGAEWTPIKNSYTGFDGDGNKISNFTITATQESIGLFARNSGVIQNLGVEDFSYNINYTGTDTLNVGGLVGTGYNLVANCYTKGVINVISTDFVYAGGLIAGEGILTNCYAAVNINVTSKDGCIGGLVSHIGSNSNSAITNCFATGNITATFNSTSNYTRAVGGLIASGGVSDLKITNCFATGNITAINILDYSVSIGGLFGKNFLGTPTNCYTYSGQVFYRKEGSNEYNAANNNIQSTLCSLVELNDASFYTRKLSWDSGIWDFTVLDFANDKYPTLK